MDSIGKNSLTQEMLREIFRGYEHAVRTFERKEVQGEFPRRLTLHTARESG